MNSLLAELAPPQPLYIGDVIHTAARRWPDLTVTTDHPLNTLPSNEAMTWTVPEVAAAVDDWAARLQAHQVVPGTHVVIWVANSFDIVVLAWAIARTGAVPVLLSSHLDHATVTALLCRLNDPVLITERDHAEDFIDAPVRKALVLETDPDHADRSLADTRTTEHLRTVRLHPEEPALITHTSGTTGLPKLIVNTSASLGARLRPQARLGSLVKKREPMAVSIAFVHSRSYTGLTVALERGWPLVIMNDPAPQQASKLLATHRPAIIEAPPNVLMTWEGLASLPSRPLANVRFYSSTFDVAHRRTMHTLLSASDRKAPFFVALYGQSETGPVAWRLFGRRGLDKADPRCVGLAWPGSTHIRIRGQRGLRSARDNPGRLEVTTRGRLQTYLGEDARFQRNVDGRWWRLGDMGYRTRFGCVHLIDREVDEIPGIASTLDIEDLLFERVPELTEVVIIDDDSRPRPIVTTHEDVPLDAGSWTTATQDFPELLTPIHVRTADLPRTATWKTQRVELIKRLHEGRLHAL